MPSRMPEFNIEGPVIAVVTPFKSDSLRVDDESLIKYLQVTQCPASWRLSFYVLLVEQDRVNITYSVQYLWEHGIQNIIVNGWGSHYQTTSQSFALS